MAYLPEKPEQRKALHAVQAASPRQSIPFKWANEIRSDYAGPLELVEGVLCAGKFAMAFGESNSGKTYLATHLGICMSRGEAWLGRQLVPAPVIYIAGEGAASVEMRARAYMREHKCELDRFGIIGTALSLLDPSADVEGLVELVNAKTEEVQEKVQLVIVDTLARAMAGADENSGLDMGRLVRAVDRIIENTGAAVLVVHHSGKDFFKGARGHSSLKAALDTEIEISAANGLHVAKITKQRDLSTVGLELFARFRPIEMGTNQWGNPITACVVEDAMGEAPAEQSRTTPTKLPPAAQNVLRALEVALADHGEAMSKTSILPGGKGVRIEHLRTAFKTAHPVENSDDPKEARTLRHTRDTKFLRGLEYCQARAVIGVAGDWVWKC